MERVLEVDSLVTRFGADRIHDGVSFSVARGEVVALIGPSGTGKSVLLKEIIGLARPTSGRISVLGTDVWRASPAELNALRRRFGMLFQDGALFSSLTVAENIAVPFREHTDLPPDLVAALVGFKLALVGLPPDTGAKMPAELSGGMRKRVALAQALILDPEIILMDEPFAALDIQTRHLMENELLELWSANRKSVVFITHDLEEAISLSDRVVVMSAGPESHPIGEFVIDLPRPRDVAEIRLTPRFIELHGLIWGAMKEEVLKSYARQRQ